MREKVKKIWLKVLQQIKIIYIFAVAKPMETAFGQFIDIH